MLLKDYITGKEIPNVGAEENRQAVAKYLVEEKGFAKEDLQVIQPSGAEILKAEDACLGRPCGFQRSSENVRILAGRDERVGLPLSISLQLVNALRVELDSDLAKACQSREGNRDREEIAAGSHLLILGLADGT